MGDELTGSRRFVAMSLVGQVADLVILADVVLSDIGIIDDRLAITVGEDSPFADHVGPVGHFESFAKLVVGQ